MRARTLAPAFFYSPAGTAAALAATVMAIIAISLSKRKSQTENSLLMGQNPRPFALSYRHQDILDPIS